MKIKYSPVKWNEYAKINSLPDTEIKFIDENSIMIDGETYEFDEGIQFPDITQQTNSVILDAYRDAGGELFLTVRRFYTESCKEWDTGGYHEIKRND